MVLLFWGGEEEEEEEEEEGGGGVGKMSRRIPDAEGAGGERERKVASRRTRKIFWSNCQGKIRALRRSTYVVLRSPW